MQHNFRFYGCDNCSSSGKGRIIKALSEGEKGIIWVGTDDDGVYTVNTLTGEVKPFRTASDIGASQYIVSDLLYDGNQLFVATYERGLEVFDLRTGRVKSYSHDPGRRTFASLVACLRPFQERYRAYLSGNGQRVVPL